jgi:hypothetical protein
LEGNYASPAKWTWLAEKKVAHRLYLGSTSGIENIKNDIKSVTEC